MIDLPLEGRMVEGSQKYRRRDRVPKAECRREEIITGNLEKITKKLK